MLELKTNCATVTSELKMETPLPMGQPGQDEDFKVFNKERRHSIPPDNYKLQSNKNGLNGSHPKKQGPLKMVMMHGGRQRVIPVQVSVYESTFDHYAVITPDKATCAACAVISLVNTTIKSTHQSASRTSSHSSSHTHESIPKLHLSHHPRTSSQSPSHTQESVAKLHLHKQHKSVRSTHSSREHIRQCNLELQVIPQDCDANIVRFRASSVQELQAWSSAMTSTRGMDSPAPNTLGGRRTSLKGQSHPQLEVLTEE